MTGRNLIEKAIRALDAGYKIGKELTTRRVDVKMTLGHQTRRCEDNRKLRLSFGVNSCEEVSHPLRRCEDGASEQARVRTTIEKKKVNMKV